MIVMCGVVFRPEYRVEEVAGAIVHFAHESAFGTCTRPCRENAHPVLVADYESRDIERYGGAVMALSSLRPSIDTETEIAAEVLDLREARTHITERRWLQHARAPQCQQQRNAA